MRNLIIQTLIIITIIQNPEQTIANDRISHLNFSNTGTWNAGFEAKANQGTALLAIWKIELPPPSANHSPETTTELNQLLALIPARTSESIQRAKSQITLQGFVFGDYQFDSGSHPKIDALLRYASQQATPLIFATKKLFDRPRPSALNPEIQPAIPNPPHPAYPSGHAAEAYLFAHILSALDPSTSDTNTAAAQDIATNRELVGVHYPSDSEAGRLLAEQLFRHLQTTPKFQELFKTASSHE